MAAFTELDFRRLDVGAIVEGRGIALSNPAERASIHTWLRLEGYELVVLDFGQGLSANVAALGELLKWQDQFGYALEPSSRNLDALRDGFTFTFEEGSTGVVLHLLGIEKARGENEEWVTGLLQIISENSLRELALGRRFFAVIEE